MKKNIIALTGAGISAESGIQTFRGAGGLWNGYPIAEVASIDGWYANPAKVLDFYNLRRTDAAKAQPNEAHRQLVRLAQHHHVTIITQNVDDLHERAGSEQVIHLHGMLRQARSTQPPRLVYDIGDSPLHIGDTCEQGSQLRPHIVWFGEAVPLIETAAALTTQADVLLIIGTSLQVYPAAGLIDHAPIAASKYYIDLHPNTDGLHRYRNLHIVAERATVGLAHVVSQLIA